MGKVTWSVLRDNDLNEAINILNDLDWHLTIYQSGTNWVVNSGDGTLYIADSHEEMKAFLLGMALSFAVLPPSIIDAIKTIIAE